MKCSGLKEWDKGGEGHVIQCPWLQNGKYAIQQQEGKVAALPYAACVSDQASARGRIGLGGVAGVCADAEGKWQELEAALPHFTLR